MSERKKWVMPDWMEAYRNLFCNTGGDTVENLMNDDTDARVNFPRAVLAGCTQSQVIILTRLKNAHLLIIRDPTG